MLNITSIRPVEQPPFDYEYKLYDEVWSPIGLGVITAIVIDEVMPYTVSFPNGVCDFFDGCNLLLNARPVYTAVNSLQARNLHLVYST